MSNRLVLHVGMPKCGSTSIQQCLSIESSALSKKNIFVPNELNFDKSWILSAAVLNSKDLQYFTDVLRVFSLDEFDNVKENLLGDLKKIKESLQNKKNYTIVVSSEYLYSKCLTGQSIESLKNLFDGWFDEIEIIFVVKNPMANMRSMYSQYVQGPSMGATSFQEYIDNNTSNPIYNYSQQINIWKKTFTNSDLKIINLDNLVEHNGLVNVFMRFLYKSDNTFIHHQALFSNKSLGYQNLVMLSKFNLFKQKNIFLNSLSFNNKLIRLIRNIIRYLPLNGTFPERESVKLNLSYRIFLKNHISDIYK